MPNINVNALSFSYEPYKEILSNIYFSAQNQESIGIIGANGVGKSTFLKLLVGLLTTPYGQIFINDLLVKKDNLSILREKIGYVFQDSNHQLFMSTVFEDVAFAPRHYGYPSNEVNQRVMHALQEVHMTAFRDTPIYKLSSGQKKLVAIATVLSMNPDIILLDEPSSTLDPRNRKQLIHILNDMSDLKLIASHDLDLIYDTCERTILLSDHQIIVDGATKEILQDETLLLQHGLELPLKFQR